MALRFVIGRSGAGKTHHCLSAITDRILERPDGAPLIMLVPEQATFQTEYALLGKPDSPLKGTIRAQALSFRVSSFRVMQETGGTALTPIGENGKNMLLYKIVSRLNKELQLFQGSESQHGFIERLGELMTEWKRYGIDAEALRAFGDHHVASTRSSLLGRKLGDLQLISNRLEQELAGLYIDAEDYLAWLVKGFHEAPSMRDCEIWVDGFHGFTPKELEALEALMKHAKNMTVTLCLDKHYGNGEMPHELDLFRPTAETFLKLRDLAANNGLAIEEPLLLGGTPYRFNDSPMLAHVERQYGHAGRKPLRLSAGELADGAISLHAASGRRAEVEAAARDIVRRVRDEGLRYRDLAVMVRNAPDYNDYIKAIFADYGIPFFLDQKNAALHHPLVEFIRSALEIAAFGWRFEAVFRCIKTELLIPDDGSVTRETFDLLENYALATGMNGNKWPSPSQWKPLMRDTLDGDPVQAGERELREFEAILDAREAVVPVLKKFIRELKKAADVRGMCEAVYRLLTAVDAPDRLERWSRKESAAGNALRAREHRQLWDGVMDLLDQLTEMTGSEAVPIELFAGMAETGLESLKLAVGAAFARSSADRQHGPDAIGERSRLLFARRQRRRHAAADAGGRRADGAGAGKDGKRRPRHGAGRPQEAARRAVHDLQRAHHAEPASLDQLAACGRRRQEPAALRGHPAREEAVSGPRGNGSRRRTGAGHAGSGAAVVHGAIPSGRCPI